MAALGGYPLSKRKFSLRSEAMAVDPEVRKIKKVKTKWKSDISPKDKTDKKPVTKIVKVKKSTKKVVTAEQIELLKILRTPAFSIEDKFKVLDARDKLIRLRTKKQSDLSKAKVTQGTCPDMCPEKERLLREIQHQISIFEQQPSGKGMNPQLAVKQYSRSSADQEVPLPHELRPVHVLQQTMYYLMSRIMNQCDLSDDTNIAEWYHFLWDRTRGIRKDITQQELCCLGSVELVEQCARFHIHCSARLVNEDPSVFDQKINTENLTKCLQSLKYMYHDLSLKNIRCPHEAEFRAYIILLNLNDGNFMWEVQQLHPGIQKSSEVRFALQVYSAIDKNNYTKFFKLVHSTTYLNACILLRYFVQIRLKALQTILKSYSPGIQLTQFPLDELTKVLAFEDIPSTIEFLEYYGLKMNPERTHVILDRKSFRSPELPFALDRAIKVVESKRGCSVGEIVNGAVLPTPPFRGYKPHDSFNEAGFVDISELLGDFKDIETQMLKTQSESKKVSLEVPPSGQSVLGNSVGELGARTSPNRNIFGTPTSKPTEIKSKPQIENKSIFGRALTDTVDSGNKSKTLWPRENKSENAPFWALSNKTDQQKQPFGFILPAQTAASTSVSTTNIFAKPADSVSSMKSIFGSPKATITQAFSFTTQPSIFADPKPSIFQTSTQRSSPFGNFQAKQSKPPMGGFTFDLKVSGTKSIANKEEEEKEIPLEEQSLESLEAQRRKLQQQLEEQQMLLEEKKRKAEEAMRKKEEERRKAEQKALEEKLKQEEEQRRKMEELREMEMQRKMEEMRRKAEEERKAFEEKRRKEEEERRRKILEEQRKIAEQKRREEEERCKMEEIKKTVTQLMQDMLKEVEENLKKERVEEIGRHVKKWKLSLFIQKWHRKVESNKRKRKVMETSPAWISARSVDQEAAELHMDMQELTLNNIKRYKMGKPLELELPKEPEIDKINMHSLCECLINNYGKNDFKPHRELFWKITISFPDFRELKYGLNFIDEILKKHLGWEEDKYGNTSVITQTKLSNNTVTCCLERRQGIRTFECDTNGLLFVAKNCNDFLVSRIRESIKKFKRNVSIPISIILLNENQHENEMKELKDFLNDEEHICEYNISKVKLGPLSLTQTVDENLSILALFTKKPPPLQLNTLYDFLKENLCSDLWNYVTSYAKWNNSYKQCLRRPNVVLSLFNEAVDRLKEIVNSEDNKEFCDFPDEFQDYLGTKIPALLPTDYRYFPKFWKKNEYMLLVSKEIDNLKVPEYRRSWPPKNESELERDIFDYCCEVFPQNNKIFYKLMAVVLKHFDPTENFERIRKISWVDVIEVIALEKLESLNFSLRSTEFYSKSIYNQFIVVYNPKDLEAFLRGPWFYVRNSLISSEMKQITRSSPNKVYKHVKKNRVQEGMYEEKIDFDLDATLNDIAIKSFEGEKELEKKKTTLKDLEALMVDLEESMSVQRKISERFQHTVKSVLMDV